MVIVISMMNRFELSTRITHDAFIPIAIHPKIVAKSIGPGGKAALRYNNTAEPIKRNTAIIAVGYSKFSINLEVRHEK